MKILLYNIGYTLGLNGSLQDYIFNSHRYLYCPPQVRYQIAEEITQLVKQVDPDICTFLEISEKGKLLDGYHHLISELENEYSFFDMENKYGRKSILRKLAFFHERCNAVLSRQSLEIRKHYLEHGMKKLVFEIDLKDQLSIFIVHFALNKRVRALQLREMEQMIKKREKVIVCGDFNIFGGITELDNLIDETGVRVINEPMDYTFPACKPTKTLDLFLCSDNVDVRQLTVLPSLSSDHLPVLLEINH
jgi:endonuclease/exonuclease/phosphatase family metal-dependent hydrolase